MTAAEADAKVQSIIEQAAPAKLTAEQICGHWHEVPPPSAEKRRLVEDAVDRLFDQGKIGREYIPAQNYCYFKKQ